MIRIHLARVADLLRSILDAFPPGSPYDRAIRRRIEGALIVLDGIASSKPDTES